MLKNNKTIALNIISDLLLVFNNLENKRQKTQTNGLL